MKATFEVRKEFLPIFEDGKRWFICIAHRRAGKTCASVQKLVLSALKSDLPHSRFAYCAPQYNQAKSIAWDLLKNMCMDIPGANFNESELRVDFSNGSRIRLFGADNPKQPMRGQRFDGIILDELAQMPQNFWGEVVRPCLADRKGWAGLIGTPRGKGNIFYDFWNNADDTWTKLELRASKTGLVDDEELREMRKTMTEAEYQQEMECSFDAAIRGAYYGQLLTKADEERRISNVPYDQTILVETWWDLGVGDSTVIWFVQRAGQEIHVIDYYEMTGEGLPHYARLVDSKGYQYSQHIAPHDIRVRELGSGKSRLEIAADLGINFTIAPKQPVDDGIQAVRAILPRCWFDADKCKHGIEALRQYRTEYDERLRVFRQRPLHDWTSHAADAFRYGAITSPPDQGWGEIKYNTGYIV